MRPITPCLWFDGQAEEAMRFYLSVFPEAEVGHTLLHTEASPGAAGSVVAMTIRIAGQELMAMNGGPQFTFTPAISLFITCDTQAEIDDYWAKLTDGGEEWQCGWLKDRYGVTWLVAPARLLALLQDPDRAMANRAMQAMMGMVKIDLAAIEAAASGN
jgi:predicted 3-demethylubiquinone-9 3-methyltransferase (glyoxalase superfamily)